MSVIVDWLVRDQVIIWESSGKVTGEELARGNDCIRTLLAEARERDLPGVHIFVDGYRVHQSPKSFYAMKHWFSYLQESGFDWHVICVSDSAIRKVCMDFVTEFKIDKLIVEDDIITGLKFLDQKLGKTDEESSLLNHYRRWVRTTRDRAYMSR